MGPQQKIAHHYSLLLWYIYMTFTFGMFFPSLFPIALLGMINSYVANKMSIVYFYTKPPNYGKRIVLNFLRIARYAPCMMFTLGYWALGNPRIFKNEVPELVKPGPNLLTNPIKSVHHYFDILEKDAWM